MPRKTLYFLMFFPIISSFSYGEAIKENTQSKTDVSGPSSWVDTLKHWIGLPAIVQESDPHKDNQSTTVSDKHDVAKESQAPLKIPATLVQPILDEKEKQKRMKEYQTFEEKILKEEEDTIASIEEATREKMDILMKDQRVTVLTTKNPNITVQDLPEDIYRTILDLSNNQENQINQITDETDQKLKEKAKTLEIEHDLNHGEARDNDERKPPLPFAPKTKVMDIGRDEHVETKDIAPLKKR